MRLIDADALAEVLGIAEDCQDCQYKNVMFCKKSSDFVDACEAIYDAPTVEPERHGRWIHIRTEPDGNALYECSECHKGEVHVPIVEVHYCWNCGARMDGE